GEDQEGQVPRGVELHDLSKTSLKSVRFFPSGQELERGSGPSRGLPRWPRDLQRRSLAAPAPGAPPPVAPGRLQPRPPHPPLGRPAHPPPLAPLGHRPVVPLLHPVAGQRLTRAPPRLGARQVRPPRLRGGAQRVGPAGPSRGITGRATPAPP